MRKLSLSRMRLVLVGALTLVASAGCYRDLDLSKIECDVNAKGACPGGYQCSAGLCVKAPNAVPDAVDGPTVETGLSPSDVAGADQPGGMDARSEEASAGTDTAPTLDTLPNTDSLTAADASTVDGANERPEDSNTATEVSGDVTATPLDAMSPDTVAVVGDSGDLASLDAVAIETEIRTIESFTIPTKDVVPTGIIRGPDDNLWFAEYKTKNIGRLTVAGVFKEFPTPSGVDELVAGPDRNIWYTSLDGKSIGRLSPTTAEVVEFPVPQSLAAWITVGPDGNIWFTDPTNNQIGKMTTNGDVVLYPVDGTPRGIVKGMDGDLWYGANGGIGRIGTDGRYKIFPFPKDNEQWASEVITVGGDGRLWFTFDDPPGKVGAMTTTGQFSEYSTNLSTSLSFSHSIVGGPDGNVWFANSHGVMRITPAGQLTFFPLPSNMSYVGYLTVGADGYIWFTDMDTNRIGRMRI